jgi:hypothetical protein
MPDQTTGDVHKGSDFSWHNAKTFWIIMIITAVILLLHILYKLTKTIHRDRHTQILELEEREPHIEEEIDHGLQRPRRAMMRRNTRSSEVSALPRYEEFNEDVKCWEDMEVERRGKYTYAVTRSWPRPRGTANGSVNVRARYDEDAVAINNDALSPAYQRE